MKFLFTKGHKVSQETREKISLANTGAKNGMFGKKSWNSGNKKVPICEICNGVKGDMRSEMCIKCRKINPYNLECGVHQDELDRALDVHHINYDKDDCDLVNLISLCRSCHIKTNYNRDYWLNYFKQNG